MSDPGRGGSAVLLRDVRKSFGPRPVLTGLDFDVPTGSVTVLLGRNGAGKTTTLDLCLGFLRADGGSAQVLGMDPWRDQDRLRPRLGVMVQAGGSHAAARAIDMLTLLARCSARPHDPARLLADLGLADVARTPVRRLSGGQAQRLGVAMALVGRPELLFLDEPTAGLDPEGRMLVWELIGAVRADGVTVVLTTHLLDEAERLADRIVILDAGRAAADGTPAELLSSAEPGFRFDTAAALDLGALRTLLGTDLTVTETAPRSYAVLGPVTPDTAATVAAFCARAGVMPSRWTDGRASLAEVYQRITTGGAR